MIQWKSKPHGICPVQAEGYFQGHYFYFRARWDRAVIEFSKTEEAWEKDIVNARYVLARVDSPDAGWLPKWICRVLIWVGCFRFLLKKDKEKRAGF